MRETKEVQDCRPHGRRPAEGPTVLWFIEACLHPSHHRRPAGSHWHSSF